MKACACLVPIPLLWLALAVPCLSGKAQTDGPRDWPGWRGPQRTGISLETGWSGTWGTNGPPVLWRSAVGKGFSSFAAVEGRVYTMGNDEQTDSVFCFEAGSGKLLWQHRYPADLHPLAYEGGPSSTPLVDGDRVFSFGKNGELFCLNATNGHALWSKSFPPWPQLPGDWQNRWGYAASAYRAGDRLFLGVGQAGLALDPADGRVLWESAAGHPGYSSPVPFRHDGREALAFFSGHAVVGVDAASGGGLWRVPWNTLWDLNAADPIIQAGRMFVSSGNGVGCAMYDLTTAEPRELWRNRNLKNTINSSVLWKGFVYGFNDTHLACISWETGEEKWSTRELRKGSLIVAGGRMLLLCETGKLVVMTPSETAYQPSAEAQVLRGRCWTAPVLSRGLLVVRNAAGDVVCLDLRAVAP